MSKAILVIDNYPSECIECPFSKVYANNHLAETHCILTATTFWNGVNERAKDCPLKRMPERQEVDYSKVLDYSDGYFAEGWNACLDEIERGTE